MEVGFWFLKNEGFKGVCVYFIDDFLCSLMIFEGLVVGVMVNVFELVGDVFLEEVLECLFLEIIVIFFLNLVCIVCYVYEFIKVLFVSVWLKEWGFLVGFNFM